MISMPLFAQMEMFRMQPEHFFVYVAFTLAFLFLAWLFNKRTTPIGTSLIFWGVLVVVLSVGYGLIGVPSVMMIVPALAKIGFLLVLGGVACSVLSVAPKRSASQETNDVG